MIILILLSTVLLVAAEPYTPSPRCPTCSLPIDPGPCYGNMKRYAYDSRIGKCREFTYGGCKGNDNNFKTLADCQARCGCGMNERFICGTRCPLTCDNYKNIPACTADCVYGCFCNDGFVRNRDGICVRPQQCPKPPTNVCTLPRCTGPCKGYFPRWYYDSQRRQCVQFIYGGCQGNANNFKTWQECQMTCGCPKSTQMWYDGMDEDDWD